MPAPPTVHVGRLLRDSLVALSLAGALAIAYMADWAFSSGQKPTDVPDEPLAIQKTQEYVEPETPPPKPLRLAVTPPDFDDMGKLLEKLGEGYRYTDISLDDLLNADRLKDFDVVFVTCGSYPDSWLGEQTGVGDRNSKSYQCKPEIVERLRQSMRRFVDRGGVLYASDWRISIVQIPFQEFAEPEPPVPGAKQVVTAEVVEEGLKEVLGSTIALDFDLPGWFPAAFRGEKVTTYLRGTYQSRDGSEVTKPLLVKIPYGEGSVFFTAFHNEKVNSEKELQLLRYLVFTMVTEKVDKQLQQTMVQGGFSPKKQSLLSATAKTQSVTQSHRCEKAGPLQFVLAFEDRGALLHLKVVGPGGKTVEREGTSTITIEVADAKLGEEWTYTVTAKKVPFENFPFKLTIWQK